MKNNTKERIEKILMKYFSANANSFNSYEKTTDQLLELVEESYSEGFRDGEKEGFFKGIATGYEVLNKNELAGTKG